MGHFTELVQYRDNRGLHRQELLVQNLDNDKRCFRCRIADSRLGRGRRHYRVPNHWLRTNHRGVGG
jgi:hypothetical protein